MGARPPLPQAGAAGCCAVLPTMLLLLQECFCGNNKRHLSAPAATQCRSELARPDRPLPLPHCAPPPPPHQVKEACDTAAKTTAAVTEAVQKVAGVEVTTDNISVRQDVKWIDGWVAVCESAMWVHGSGGWVGAEGALRVALGRGTLPWILCIPLC